MPKLATVLKDEIVRLARKEVRTEVLALRKLLTVSRADITALKRRVAAQEKQLAALGKLPAAKKPAPAQDGAVIRFSSKGFATLRRRLELSAAEMGFLLNASDQSVYKWERGVRPRPGQLPKIAALRKMSKPQVAELLRSLQH